MSQRVSELCLPWLRGCLDWVLWPDCVSIMPTLALIHRCFWGVSCLCDQTNQIYHVGGGRPLRLREIRCVQDHKLVLALKLQQASWLLAQCFLLFDCTIAQKPKGHWG